MDGGDSETQTPIYLYETLTPLSLGTAPTAPTTPDVQSPLSDDVLEHYSVFRNEISLSTLDGAVGPDTAAPDFFSLNVEEPEPEPVTPTSAQAEPVTPVRGVEPRLESAWWFRGNSRLKSPMLQLHKEIMDFCDFLSPTPEEQAYRNIAVESVFGVIKYIWPNCRVEVFGSFKTGLYLPTSDIDVVILGSGIKNPQPGLQALSRALSQRGIAKKIQVIARARVPIVKFVEKKSGVAFDVSFDVQSGPVAADFIKDAVSKWPPLRPLCLILKVFLQQRELNEVYSGGIGSYALLAMLIAMLQCLRESQPVPEHNLGVLLVHFFDFYGRKLNTVDVGVSCNGAIFFSKSSRGFMNKGRAFLISIEDPQAPENDIGKNSFNYFQIRSAFAMAFSTLTNPKSILGLGPKRSILGTIIRPDPVLLDRRGGSMGEMTFASLLPGAGEPFQLHNEDKQGILCNWQYEDEEEPLPRGDIIIQDGSAQSFGNKRTSSSRDKSGKKRIKEHGELQKARHEEGNSRREKGTKKKRWRHKNDDADRCIH